MQDQRRGAAGIVLLAALVVFGGCGARTDLWMPDEDAGPPACSSGALALSVLLPEVLFLIDRSGSMGWPLAAEAPSPTGEPSRWRLLEQALAATLAEVDPRVRMGAKFFPSDRPYSPLPGEGGSCRVAAGLDLDVAAGTLDRLLSFFRLGSPGGGTPTAVAVQNARLWFARRAGDGVPRFIVLATDGGPNCNPEPEVPPPECICTGEPYFCDPSPPPVGVGAFAALDCVDAERTVEQISIVFRAHDVPIYVIGIGNPDRPDLLDVLDRMAVAGGRPRPDDGGRRYWDVQAPDDLRSALDAITRAITHCTFRVVPAGPEDPTLVVVTIDGRYVRHDHLREDGWDFTNDARTELTLFGAACAELTEGERVPVAVVECDD